MGRTAVAGFAALAGLATLSACAPSPERTMAAPPSLAFASPRGVAEMGWCVAHAFVGANASLPAFQADGSLILTYSPRDKRNAVVTVTPSDPGSFVRVWDRTTDGDAKLAVVKCRMENAPGGPA